MSGEEILYQWDSDAQDYIPVSAKLILKVKPQLQPKHDAFELAIAMLIGFIIGAAVVIFFTLVSVPN